jgi:two-component system sensor histidine kinase QseC
MRSLQARILVLVLGLLGLVWCGAAALTWWDTRHELDELLDGHLAQAAALLVVQQAGEGEDDDHGGLDAPQLHRYAPRVAFQVFHEGALVQRSSNAPLQPMRPGAIGQVSGFETVALQGALWRVFATTGAERDVQVYVGEAIAARESILRALLRGTLAPLALALPLLGLAAWWAVRQGLKPLRRLSQDLAHRRPDALEAVHLPQAPTEMQPLVDALNGLLGRIASLLDSERRFTADAAHELRTPLAAIRAQAQVALAETDGAARHHALAATLQGCDRAARLVDQLLLLTRLEADPGPSQPAVDLAALARQVLAAAVPEATARQQTLSLQAEGTPQVCAQEALLVALLRNLVDNALRYSPEGAQVQVRVERQGTALALHVDDSGPGLSETDLARLGQRFFRVLGQPAPGSGLGWSIVRRIAAVQQAQVQVGRSASLGGLHVAITWPAAPAGAAG